MDLNHIYIHVLEYDSIEQQLSVSLRKRCLLEPMNASFTDNEYASEYNSIHIGAFYNNIIVGCIILKPIYNKNNIIEYYKVRQFVVDTNYRGKGIGTKILLFIEEYCKNNNIKQMKADVLGTAKELYERNNWKVTSKEFELVGYPHYKMEILL